MLLSSCSGPTYYLQSVSYRHREVRADALGLEVTVGAPASLSGSTEKGFLSCLL